MVCAAPRRVPELRVWATDPKMCSRGLGADDARRLHFRRAGSQGQARALPRPLGISGRAVQFPAQPISALEAATRLLVADSTAGNKNMRGCSELLACGIGPISGACTGRNGLRGGCHTKGSSDTGHRCSGGSDCLRALMVGGPLHAPHRNLALRTLLLCIRKTYAT